MENGYCSAAVLNLLKNCVTAKMNLVFYGETTVEKSECAGFFSSFVPDHEKMMVIEDTLEWHKNPNWILLSQTRLNRMVYLLRCSKSVDARNMENEIYRFVDVGVLLSRKKDIGDLNSAGGGRYVDRIFFYNRNETSHHGVMVVDDGRIVKKDLPEFVTRKLDAYGIDDIYSFGGKRNVLPTYKKAVCSCQ